MMAEHLGFRLPFVLSAMFVASCGGGSAPEGSTVTAPGGVPLPVPAPALSAAADFTARCAQPGVIKCVGFDSATDFNQGSGGTNGAFGSNSGIIPPFGTSDYSRAVMDTNVMASGSGSLRFTVPSNTGADSSGSFFTNFSPDLSVQFDGNEEFDVQWRQRFSAEFLNIAFAGGGGWKQIIIGTGDQPNQLYSSCSTLETVVQNTFLRGFPQMYNSCTGSSAHGPFDPFEEPYGPDDFKLENGRPAPFCLYSQRSTSFFPPVGNCFGYVANEWLTFQVQVKIGPRVGDVFQNSYVTLWGAREGRPSELIITWGPYSLNAGHPPDNERYGKVWLLPYNTGKDPSQSHAPAYTWYDELIISRNRVADPVPAPAPPGTATVNWTVPSLNVDGTALNDISGYRIVYGTDTGATNLTRSVDVPGSATSYTISGLSPGTYYFAVIALKADGTASNLSAFASGTVR